MYKQLEYFVEISKCKSFNEAAGRLNISQQALGESIRKLESELGLTLFSRSHSGISLTNYGMAFLDDAQKILETLRYWTRVSEQLSGEISGDVHIAAAEQAGITLVRVLTRLNNEYPNINLFPHEIRSPNIPEFMLSRQATLALLSSSHDFPQESLARFARDNAFCLDHVYTSKLYLCLNKKHMLAKRDGVYLAECGSLLLATRPNEKSITDRDVSRYFSSRKSFQLSTNLDVLRLVAENIDVATILSAIIVENELAFFSDFVTAVELCDYSFPHPIFLMYPTGNRCTLAERVVADIIKDVLGTRC